MGESKPEGQTLTPEEASSPADYVQGAALRTGPGQAEAGKAASLCAGD